jgi:hypothetical protein
MEVDKKKKLFFHLLDLTIWNSYTSVILWYQKSKTDHGKCLLLVQNLLEMSTSSIHPKRKTKSYQGKFLNQTSITTLEQTHLIIIIFCPISGIYKLFSDVKLFTSKQHYYIYYIIYHKQFQIYVHFSTPIP